MAEISEKSFPFDSLEINGTFDRDYVAEDFARYFRAFITSGVFMKQYTNLQIIANDDMTVTLKPGALIIDGYRYDVDSDIIIQLDPADGVNNRIDRISATFSLKDRDIHYTLQKGEYSYNPSPPACRRSPDYRDYVLADIYVKASVIKITQDNITDQRLNSEVCGLAFPFCDIDTTMVFNQLQAFYNKVVDENSNWFTTNTENWTKEFLKFFNVIKGQLSEDPAGNLQNQIYSINAILREITDDEIDRIVDGTYEEDDEGGYEPDIYSRVTDEEIDNIVDNAFSDV